MRILISLFIILFVSNSYGRNWNKYYKLVNSDIKSVEALKSRDLGLEVRLFELYGEKLSLLIEKERDYRIKFLETGNNKKLNGLIRNQNKTLKKLDSLGNRIESRTKDAKVITKVNYYRALNYLSTKNDKKFFQYMRKAEKTNKDKKIGYQIHTKLANYYYNENKYPQASRYYKKLLYDKKSPWLTKHYYNLAWSELKQDRFKNALNFLKKAHLYERQKGYYKIGDQLVDALLLFHAYANQTREGLEYFKRYKLNNFDNYLKYLHYVFGHGSRAETRYVINDIEKMKLTLKQEYKLLEKRILVYRTLKKFSGLQKELASFKTKLNKKDRKKVDKVTREELVLAIKSYSGYLQELIKSQRLITNKRKKIYVRYIAYNFNVLRSIDPKNALEYSYFEGETHFSILDYKKAISVYSNGLKRFKATKKRKDPYLKKTFDSVFKALENDPKPNNKSLLFAFKTYIHFFPKGKKSNDIHQRILAIYKSSGNEKEMFRSLRAYNKAFPSMVRVQRNFYKQVLNEYIDKKDIASLRDLQKLVDKKFLGFGKKESLAIEKVIKQIKFSKYEQLAKSGKVKEAIDGFYRLFSDKKGKYSLRVDALRKVMFYQNKIYDFIELSKSLVTAKKFFKSKEKRIHQKEMLFYTQNICFGDYQKSCLSTLTAFKKDKSIKLLPNLENFYFKLRTLFSTNLEKDYKMAKSIPDKNFVFKILLLEKKGFSDNLYGKFYKHKQMKSVIDGEVERNVLNEFYRTLSISETKSYIRSISIPRIKNKYNSDMSKLSNVLKSVKYKLPATPKAKIITEQIFVSFGQAVENKVSGIFQAIQNTINSTDPNYLPFVLSKIIVEFEKEVAQFKKFIPVSKNADFEAAMNDAIVNFHRIFDGKIIELRSLYYRTLQNTIKGSGVKKYGNDIITTPKKNSYGQLRLWEK